MAGVGYEALAYEVKGDHAAVSSWGSMSPPKDLIMVKPIEQVTRSGLFSGLWDSPTSLPPGVNLSANDKWGVDLSLSRNFACSSRAGLVPHVPLLADELQHPQLRAGHFEERPRAGRQEPGCGHRS